LNLIWRQVKPF